MGVPLPIARRCLGYSVGFYARADVAAAIDVDAEAWVPAIDGDAVVRDGARVSELTQALNLSGWPAGMPGDRPTSAHIAARSFAAHTGEELVIPSAKHLADREFIELYRRLGRNKVKELL